MSEKLLSLKEVSEYLGISEEDLRGLVDKGRVPAYRLGGTILRFRKDQIERIKAKGISNLVNSEDGVMEGTDIERLHNFKDFLYFYDFYIISAVIVLVLLIIIFFY